MEQNPDSYSDNLEPWTQNGWPTKFYDLPEQVPLECNESYEFAKNFVDVPNIELASSEAQLSDAPMEKQPRIDTCSKIGRNLLDLPQHILDKILMYLCCDEPSNRRNRNLRSLASTCTDLKRFVYQSYAPDYLELGIMCIASSGYETETSELDGETTQHTEHKMYSKFLEDVNWKITQLRMVVTMSTDFAAPTFRAAVRFEVDATTLPLKQLLDIRELIIDFSEFYVIPEIEVYTQRCFVGIDIEDFLIKFPQLLSLTLIPMNDQRHVYAYIQHIGSLSSHPLKRFSLQDLFASRNMDCWYFSFSMLKLSNYQNIAHMSLDMVSADDLHAIAKLPNLASFACSSMALDDAAIYPDLNTCTYDAPVFNKVRSVVVRYAYDYRHQSYFMPKMFPSLQTYETLFREQSDIYEGLVTERLSWWTFKNLGSVSIFLQQTNFSNHLCSLRLLSCLKNLCLEVTDMTLEYENVMKIFDRKDTTEPCFNLELLRLETQTPDYELDEVYVNILIPDVLLFETLDVCIISSYHERKLVPEMLKAAMENHPRLKYFRFGNQVVRYPESNKGLENKHKWSRPRLYLS